MCEFISWIQKDGKLYYLTDAEIFSPAGKKKLAGCSDNDFIGHGAIRKYFNLDYYTGHDKEVRQFWEIDRLPKELADKIRDFDTHWSKTFEKYPLANDYSYIIKNAPIKWAKKAFNTFRKSKRFTKTTIAYRLKISLDHRKASKFTQEVLEYFLKLKPAKYHLHYILKYANSTEIKKLIWKALKQRGITKYDVNELKYYFATKTYYHRAKKLLRNS